MSSSPVSAGPGEPGPTGTAPSPTWCVLGRSDGGRTALVMLDAEGAPLRSEYAAPEGLAALVGRVERESSPRWVLSDAAAWCPRLLSAGVTLQRCHDLRLVHRILRHSELVRDPAPLRAATAWDTPLDPHEPVRDTGATLFDLDAAPSRSGAVPSDLEETLAEFARQRTARR